MKKIISIIMSVIIIAAVMPFASAESVTPVIMISGFGATTLAIDGEAVFPPSKDQLLAAAGLDDLSPAHIKSEIDKWRAEKGYVQQLSDIVSRILEPVRMNADGTSYYDVKPIVSGAKNTSLAAFKKNDMLAYVPYTGSEFLDMESIGERIGDENVFNFTYDWRLDFNDTADELKKYIDDVLELTDSKKVSIYSISQGSLLVGQYLYKYSSLSQVDNVVFDTPVLGGTSFVTDLFDSSQYLTLDLRSVLLLLSDILHIETDLTFIADLLDDVQIIKDAIDYGRTEVLLPPVKSCIAAWEMIPKEEYSRVYPLFLDETENAVSIAKTTEFYNGFSSHITETFEKAERYGATISIKSCTGRNLVLNTNAYSDSIVDMKYSCGAVCAPWGETFPENYVQAVENEKNSISPDRTVDLSAGYWPHRTWVINNLFHGQVEWCPKSLALVETLLYTHDLKDAYSSYEFPQFIECTAPTSDVAITFKNTNSSFLLLDGSAEYVLTVKNLSLKDTIIIKGIESDAVSTTEKISVPLLAGESVDIAVKADTVKSGKLTVKYNILNKTFEKTFGISVVDFYSGVSVKNTSVENNKVPFIFRWIINFFKKIIKKLPFVQ